MPRLNISFCKASCYEGRGNRRCILWDDKAASLIYFDLVSSLGFYAHRRLTGDPCGFALLDQGIEVVRLKLDSGLEPEFSPDLLGWATGLTGRDQFSRITLLLPGYGIPPFIIRALRRILDR